MGKHGKSGDADATTLGRPNPLASLGVTSTCAGNCSATNSLVGDAENFCIIENSETVKVRWVRPFARSWALVGTLHSAVAPVTLRAALTAVLRAIWGAEPRLGVPGGARVARAPRASLEKEARTRLDSMGVAHGACRKVEGTAYLSKQ